MSLLSSGTTDVDTTPVAADSSAQGGVDASASAIVPVELADRIPPSWTIWISVLLVISAALCKLAVPAIAMSLQRLPGETQADLTAAILGALGVVAVLGAMVLTYVQRRLLSGYRALREYVTQRVEAAAAAIVTIALCAVHPALGLGPGVALIFALIVFARRVPPEPDWDLLPEEVTALLAGRDLRGLRRAWGQSAAPTRSTGPIGDLAILAALVTAAVACVLVVNRKLEPAAIPSLTLLVLLTVWALLDFVLARREAPWAGPGTGREAARVEERVAVEADTQMGLRVRGLSLRDRQDRPILQDIDLEVEPGAALGLIGPTGAGKSLLLTALQDPFALDGLCVRGSVTVDGSSLWSRSGDRQAPLAVLLPEVPLLLPVSGLDNLTALYRNGAEGRALRILEDLVASVDLAAEITAAPDATQLPGQQRRLLAMARALFLAPRLYLLDRPEDGLDDRAIGALATRISREKRLGRSFVMVTENRRLLELCDRIAVMQDGRIVDCAAREDIYRRKSAGWARLTLRRSLDSEETLIHWVRGLFRRPGDDGNRRAVAFIASELLAYACQGDGDGHGDDGRVHFDFKHGVELATLRMSDHGPMPSSGAIERARREGASGAALTPLASVLQAAKTFDVREEEGCRVIEVGIATYDPRRSTATVPVQIPAKEPFVAT